MQCAAVTTIRSEMRAAPQYCPDEVVLGLINATSQGYSSGSAGLPPTILVWNFLAFVPHSKKCKMKLNFKISQYLDIL